MVSAVIAAFLYLRIVVSMYMSAPEGQEDEAVDLPGGPVRVGVGAWIGIAVCLIVTMVVGIVPDTVLDPAEKATPALVQVADAPASSAGTGSLGTGDLGTVQSGGG